MEPLLVAGCSSGWKSLYVYPLGSHMQYSFARTLADKSLPLGWAWLFGGLLASNVCLQEAAYKGHYVFLCAVASYDDKRSEKWRKNQRVVASRNNKLDYSSRIRRFFRSLFPITGAVVGRPVLYTDSLSAALYLSSAHYVSLLGYCA